MTREEAIETIKTAIAEVEWEYPMNYAAAFEVAIKALEQQSVLDKIRAEIEEERSFQRVIEEYYIATGLRKALEIIDEYKAESEEKNE